MGCEWGPQAPPCGVAWMSSLPVSTNEDLLVLDIPDILQALLATEEPSTLFQPRVPARGPMTTFSMPFCLASMPIADMGVGTVIVGQQPEIAAQTQKDAQKHSQKHMQKEQPRLRGFDVQLQRYIARRKFEQKWLASRSETSSLEAVAKTQARRDRALKRVRVARALYAQGGLRRPSAHAH